MSQKVTIFCAVLSVVFLLSACGMMAKMMGMGDMMNSMENMDKVMKDMNMQQRKQHMMSKQREMLAYGNKLFHDASLGSNGQNCASCHPNGGTIGGEAQVPMTKMKLPIPRLTGASATFPKYKVPNDRVITLDQMDNNCIKMFMQGKPLALNSREAIALAMYVTSFSNGEKVDVTSSN